MKHYGDHSASDIRMSEHEGLKSLLERLFVEEDVDVVIETGTFDGLESTTLLAKSFEGRNPPEHFYAMELNPSKYKRARRNLRRFPFVQCLWGRSVKLNEALDFIQKDDAILHHEKYPEIFIDGLENRVDMYMDECKRGFHARRKAFWYAINPLHHLRRFMWYQGEDLLRRLLIRHRPEKPFILLDSGGGIGLMEFQIVETVMQEEPFWLLLDDIHHLKHFRGISLVKSNPSYQILGSDVRHGWALATYEPARKEAKANVTAGDC